MATADWAAFFMSVRRETGSAILLTSRPTAHSAKRR